MGGAGTVQAISVTWPSICYEVTLKHEDIR